MSQPSEAVLRWNPACLPLASIPNLDWELFTEQLLGQVTAGDRVVDYFAAPAANGELELFCLLTQDWQGTLTVLRTRIGRSLPSLTPRCSQLHLFEREIAEQFGVVVEGHPWLKPVRFEAGWTPDPPAPIGAMPFYRVEGTDIHEVAVGPVHAGIIEPGHFRFQCHGETVLHLEISLGYQHRGVERLLLGGPHPTGIHQLEAVAGDTSIGHASAYSMLLEALGAMEPSPRAQALRAIALELERLANHVGDIGALAGDIGFLPTAAFCGRLRGDCLNLTAELCGSRFGRGLIRPGGVGFDLDAAQADAMGQRLHAVERNIRGCLELFFDTPSVLARLEGVGRVSVDAAEALGLVGVAARGCGLVRDARLHHPGGHYRRRFDEAIIEETGDVWARANIRRRETYLALRLLRQWLAELPAGPLRTEVAAPEAETLAVALVEGWRGEIVHTALTDAAGRFRRYRIVDPSLHNWSGLALALRGEQISDFPLCNKSFNLSYCGFDL